MELQRSAGMAPAPGRAATCHDIIPIHELSSAMRNPGCILVTCAAV